MSKVNNILSVGRLQACRRSPYFQAALLALVPVAKPGLGTVASTADFLFLYDPEVIEKWEKENDEYIPFAFFHELMHCVLKHQERCGTRQPKLWNLATDIWINEQAVAAGYVMPPGGVLPKTFNFASNLTPGEYYALLLKKQEEQEKQRQKQKGKGKGQGEGQGGGDKEDDGEGGGEPDLTPGKPQMGGGWCGSCAGNPVPDEPEGDAAAEAGGRSEADVENIRRVTAESVKDHGSKGRGFVPSGLNRWAEEVLGTPKIAWQTLLARATRNAIAYRAGAVDYRYSRVSRRQAACGFGPGRPIMPALIAPVPRVALVLDTSGSMGHEDVKAGLTEAAGVLKAVGADIQFCACDAAVHELKKVRSAGQLQKLVKGGGGTSFVPAFEALAKLKERPEVVVFATDGGGDAPATPPKGMHVIWLLIGGHKQHPWFRDGAEEWGTFIEIND
jgi:predicted metal-dependent peptidase